MSAFAGIFDFLAQWGSAFWLTLRETGPFLVFGLVLAGVLHVLVPPRIVLWALGHGGWRGALRGALIGTPLPLCSCGVVPTALTLRRQGASLSATTAFTISTPETSIDALAITAALLPSVFLGVRPVAAILLAFLVGLIVELFSTTTREELRLNVLKLSRAIETSENGENGEACHDEHSDDCGASAPASGESADICRVCGLLSAGEHSHGTAAKLKAVFTYAFGTFFRDIATWLLIGLVFAALLQVSVPADAFNGSWIARHPSLQILGAILIGIPLYSCATAATPMVAVLLAKGMNPGAALALLLAGPATNVGNIFAFKRELGGRITFVYYAALAIFCYILGLAFTFAWPLVERFPALTQVSQIQGVDWLVHGIPGWLEVFTAWLLLVLAAKIWVTSLFAHDHHHDHAGHSH